MSRRAIVVSAPRNLWGASGLLAAGLAVTILACLYIKADVDAAARREFDFACNEIRQNIADRLSANAQILRSGAALFKASESVSRQKWKVFAEALDLDQNLPGIQGIGYALSIPRTQLTSHVQAIRDEGFSDYAVRPAGEREIYSSIIFLEPFSGRNLRAFGYDMFSEPIRRAAMERARDENAIALSGKVILVQETDESVQAGTLLYLPVYRHGLPIETVEQRRAAIQGWVYSPYRMTDLMDGTLRDWDLKLRDRQIFLQVHDGDVLSAGTLLFDSTRAGNKTLASNLNVSGQIASEKMIRLIPVEFAGRHWTLRFTQLGGLAFSKYYVGVWLVFSGGTIISLLLFGLALSFFNARVNERQLRESERKQRVLFANSPDAYLILTQDTITDCNRAAEIMLCGERSQILGQTLAHFSPELQPDGRNSALALAEKISQAVSTGNTTFEWTHRRLDGSDFPVEVSISPIPMQGQSLLFASWRDITARKRAEDEMLRANAYLDNLIDYANAPIIVWDPKFRITRFNHAFEFLTGRRESEVLGQSPEILFPHAQAARSMALIGKTLTGERWETVEIEIQHRDESVRTVLWNSATLFEPDSRIPIATIAQGQEITRRKRTEEALRKSTAELEVLNGRLESTVAERTSQLEASNKELESFAYSISHDLRAPLRAMEGFSNHLLKTHRDSFDSQSVHQLERIQAASRRMGLLINDLLSLSQVTRIGFHSADVDLSLIASRILLRFGILNPTRKAQISIMPGLLVRGDEKLLSILLGHLLDNAWKFTVSRIPAVIAVGGKTIQGEEVFYVQDNGVGFDMDWQSQLFKPFIKLDGMEATSGAGIGLVTARKIVERHGGRIWAESAPDAGATFFFTLKPPKTV